MGDRSHHRSRHRRADGDRLQVYGDDELMALTLETARTIAAYTGVGLRLTKQAMWANLDAPGLESCLALEDRNQGPGRCLGRGLGVHGELPVTLFRQGVTAGGLSGQSATAGQSLSTISSPHG